MTVTEITTPMTIHARITLVLPKARYKRERLDAIALRLIERTILEARTTARKRPARYNNEALDWLETTGVRWCEILGGPEYRNKMIDLCEELRLMTEGKQTGAVYIPSRCVTLYGRQKENKRGHFASC